MNEVIFKRFGAAWRPTNMFIISTLGLLLDFLVQAIKVVLDRLTIFSAERC